MRYDDAVLDKMDERMIRTSLFVAQSMRLPPPPPPPSTPTAPDSAGTNTTSKSPGLGTWQLWGLDWAVDVAGAVSLLEVNAAPAIVKKAHGDVQWQRMLELVALLYSAPSAYVRSLSARGGGWRYHGWRLLLNEAEEEAAGRPPYDACAVPMPGE